MDSLVQQFLRPDRHSYHIIDLGKPGSENWYRFDGTFPSPRTGYKIYYSYYQHTSKTNQCVIYAHCNSGSRLEGLQYVNQITKNGWNALIFDFTGSGLSGGEHISLGFREADDLAQVVELARKKGNTKIVLWGRSMGASTILRYMQKIAAKNENQHKLITACVLDSPYANLWRLSKELGSKYTGLPSFIMSGLLSLVRGKILREQGFDIQDMDLVKEINLLDTPLMFIVSRKDTLTNSDHSMELFKAYKGQKVMEYVDEDHNMPRNDDTIRIIMQYIRKNMRNGYDLTKKSVIFKSRPRVQGQAIPNNHNTSIDKQQKERWTRSKINSLPEKELLGSMMANHSSEKKIKMLYVSNTNAVNTKSSIIHGSYLDAISAPKTDPKKQNGQTTSSIRQIPSYNLKSQLHKPIFDPN